VITQFQLEQEALVRPLMRPEGYAEIPSELALLSAPEVIDDSRVERIYAVMCEHESWGPLPPVRGYLRCLDADALAAPDSGIWTREPTLEDCGNAYLELVGGGTHRALAAHRAGVPLRFLLAFTHSSRAVDDSRLIREAMKDDETLA